MRDLPSRFHVVSAVLLTALVVGAPTVAMSVPRLLGVPEMMAALEQPAASSEPASVTQQDNSSTIRARLPAALVRDVPLPIQLDVSGLPDGLVVVTLDLDVTEAAAGWVVVEPDRFVTEVTALPGTDVHLLGFGALPCSDTTGTMRIGIEEVAEPGGQADLEVDLPGIPCDAAEPPPAPRTVHLMDPVCGEDWRADAEALAQGDRPGSAWCRPEQREERPSRDRDAERREREERERRERQQGERREQEQREREEQERREQEEREEQERREQEEREEQERREQEEREREEQERREQEEREDEERGEDGGSESGNG